MKAVFVFLIEIYQVFLSPMLKSLVGVRSNCLYTKSCSSYAKDAILQKGVIIGSYFALLRIFSCQRLIHLKGSFL